MRFGKAILPSRPAATQSKGRSDSSRGETSPGEHPAPLHLRNAFLEGPGLGSRSLGSKRTNLIAEVGPMSSLWVDRQLLALPGPRRNADDGEGWELENSEDGVSEERGGPLDEPGWCAVKNILHYTVRRCLQNCMKGERLGTRLRPAGDDIESPTMMKPSTVLVASGGSHHRPHSRGMASPSGTAMMKENHHDQERGDVVSLAHHDHGRGGGPSNRKDENDATTTTAEDAVRLIEYEVLYYKTTRKVHKSKGVSKLDGILSIDPSTGRVVLWGEKQSEEEECPNDVKKGHAGSSSSSQPPNGRVVLHSGLNSALHRRCHDLEADENLRLGGYEVDVVAARTKTTSKTVVVTGTAAAMSTITKTASCSNHKLTMTSKSTGLLRRPTVLPAKRPLGSIVIPSNRPRTGIASSAPRPAQKPGRAKAETVQAQSPFDARTAGPLVPSPSALPPVMPKRTIVRRPLHSTASLAARAAATRPPPGPVRLSQGARRPAAPRIATTTVSSASAAVGGASTTVATRFEHHNDIGSDDDDDDDVLRRMPVKVASVLRQHQVGAVQFLWNNLHKAGGGAILADEPGLGKTLTTIACISALHRANRAKHFCVVCPSSLVNNWVKEFDHWLGKQGQPKRVPLLKGDTTFNSSSMKSFLHSKVGQVVIMSFDLFRLHSHHFAPPARTIQMQSNNPHDRFALLVVDEGHRLKSTSGSQTLSSLELLPADARLLLSATPIQNNLGELFTLANFCKPGILGNDIAEFRRRFERPIASGNGSRGARQELDHILSTFMLRRLQSDVLKSMLPPRMEALIFCRPSQRQCELYRDVVAAATSNTTSIDVLSALTSLRKVCSHPYLHNGTARVDHTTGSRGGNDVQLSGKLVVLQGLLQSMRTSTVTDASVATTSDKVVIVSNFTSTLSLVESLLLKPAGYTYVRLDGSTSPESRQSLVEAFNKQSKIFCFLLSSKAGGCGLNLIGANRLVLLDPSWNPADDIQAMGRIYRQGQQRPTSIYRLFTSGTIEEVIYQCQMSKNKLSGGVLDKKGGQAFTRDEINECMNLKVGCECDTRRKASGTSWPPYSGPSSLLDQGVADGPLTHVATNLGEAVGFVRIVPDLGVDESGTWEGSGSATMSTELYDSDQEEELEFDSDENDGKPSAALSDDKGSDSLSDSESEF